MSNIEIIICLVLLFMAVPDVCRKLGRPALVFSAFVIFGLLLSPVANGSVKTMLMQAGEVGFLLLLFEVGLEIELPKLKDFIRPLKYAVKWGLIQYPLVFMLGMIVGLDWLECLVAAAALTACSVGMAHPAWKAFPGLGGETRGFVLQVMVALEVIAIAVLALETSALGRGLSWTILLKLAGIGITIYLIARFASHLQDLFATILDRTTHWRVHWLVLLVLAICAVGQRLGLDAAKTAFFLGLALSGIRHRGIALEEHMAAVSHRFLIPVFFVALGLQIEWRFLISSVAPLAFGTAGLLLGVREIIHRRWLTTGSRSEAFLLFCPNLTIVALAAKAMHDHGADSQLTTWLVLTGLFMTVPALLMLPAGANPAEPAQPAEETQISGETPAVMATSEKAE